MIICAVYDAKMAEYMNPFAAKTPGSAIRAFADEAKREDSQVARHPEDFTLYQVAVFDEVSGRVTEELQPLLRAVDA